MSSQNFYVVFVTVEILDAQKNIIPKSGLGNCMKIDEFEILKGLNIDGVTFSVAFVANNITPNEFKKFISMTAIQAERVVMNQREDPTLYNYSNSSDTEDDTEDDEE